MIRRLVHVAVATLGLPSAVGAVELLCPAVFATHGERIVCAVADYDSNPRAVMMQLFDGRNGQEEGDNFEDPTPTAAARPWSAAERSLGTGISASGA